MTGLPVPVGTLNLIRAVWGIHHHRFDLFVKCSRPPHVVGNPPLRESVKLVELCLRVVFRGVADVNPVDQKLLDLVTGEVRILFMDALNGLLKIEPVRVRPDELTLLGIDLHVLQHILDGIAYLCP